ncbi:MAG: hypothetical protein WC362_07580 [Methanoregula sp.]|jgi:hypothetical protein
MKHQRIIFILTLAVALIFLTCPIQADTGGVLYQSTFATDPHWTTNNPSVDYWDQAKEMYHFSIEPSTQNYAYTPAIDYETGSFTLEYDVTLTQVDEDASFRLGFSGTDMDRNKGPNVVTEFTNAKYGQILWLHIVTQSAKMEEVNSDTSSYKGPSVKYAVDTPYHVKVDYNDDSDVVTETVTNKATGEQLWSYYVATQESLRGMKRIYIGSVGDYSTSSRYAVGWIDNVRLTTTADETTTTLTTPTTQPTTSLPTYSLRPTTKTTTFVSLTPIQTTTKKAPSSVLVVLAALGILGTCAVVRMQRPKKV